MQSGDWMPEHSQALRDHVARGISFARAAAEINAQFGTAYTRSAALGRGKRMGLIVPARREAGPAPAKALKPMKTRKRRGAEPSGPEPEPEAVPVVAAAPLMLRCVGISPRLISLVELEPCDCRYPYGGEKENEPIAFCGHPRRPGSRYCTPHFHLTRRVGTAAERSFGPVILRLVQAA